MAEGETLGASFSIDVTSLKAGLAQANRLIRESESEFKAAAAGMDDWQTSQDGLSAKIQSLNNIVGIQREKVRAMTEQYESLISQGIDPTSAQMVKLRTDINNEQAALNKNEAALKQQKAALAAMTGESNDTRTAAQKLRDEIAKQEKTLADLKEEYLNVTLEQGKNSKKAKELKGQINKLNGELEKNKSKLTDTGNASKDVSKNFEGLKKAGGVAVGAIAGIAAACVAAVGSFLSLAESTREFREDQAKLQTAFQTAGFSAEAATKTYRDFYAVLGEEDRSVEAANHLAKLTSNEQELAQWSDIAAGVVATFGDSLPIEGLTEAANETAKVGKVTGPLADALNWAGVSEDEFNESLAACNSEQERSTLITSTLNGLYSEAADKYKELNGDVMAARDAQAQLTDATAELGAIAEPIMTTLKTLAADLLKEITPFVALIAEGLTGALDGASGAADNMAMGLTGIVSTISEKITAILPTVISVITQLVPQIVTALVGQLPTILQTLITIVLQVISTLTAIMPQVITAIMDVIPQLINGLVAAVPQLLQAAITFLMAIVQAIPTIITNLIAALPTIIQTIITALVQSIPILIQAAIQLLMAIVQAIPTIINALITALPTIIDTIVTGILDGLPLLLQGAIQLLMAIVQAIPQFLPSLIGALPQIVTTLTTTLLRNLPAILKCALTLFLELLKAIPTLIKDLSALMPTVIDAIVSGLSDGISSVASVGSDLVEGLWNGINDMVGWITGKLSEFGDAVMGALKSFFGIASPSKVMANVVGKNLALGIGKGFEDSIGAVNKEITGAMQFDDASVNVNAQRNSGAAGAAGAGGSVIVYQTNNYSQAHSRYEIFKSKQETAAAVRLALKGG